MSRCSYKMLWVRFCGVWRVVWVGWPSILVDNATRPASSAKIHFSDLVSPRLYSKGRILGHKRAKRNTRPNTSLLQIEGVASKEDAQFYLGKRVAYVYRAKREVQGSKVRVIWGWGFSFFYFYLTMIKRHCAGVLPAHMDHPVLSNQNSEWTFLHERSAHLSVS